MKSRAERRESARGFFVTAILCLFLLRILAPVLFPNGVVTLAHAGFLSGASVSAEVCDENSHGDRQTPVPHPHRHQDCTLCVVCGHESSLDRAVLPMSDNMFVSPRPESAGTWPDFGGPTAMPSGWASSWSSRAPPFFS